MDKNIETFKPNLIIYNAGTDIIKGDPEGKLNFNEQDIIERDTTVFNLAMKNKAKFIMVTSGGYTNKSAPIVAESIKAIIKLSKKYKK